MATRYITLSEMNSFLGISGEDSHITSLIEGAESIFDTLIKSELGLLTSTKTEYHDPKEYNTGFWLRTYKPTDITTINGVDPGTIGTDYIIDGTRLVLKEALLFPTDFPYNFKIVYVSGFADINAIPQDVKIAIKYIVAGLYNTTKSQGIASYKQDLLSVNYTDASSLSKITSKENTDFITMTADKYRIYELYA